MVWRRLLPGHEDLLRHYILPFVLDAKDAPVYKSKLREKHTRDIETERYGIRPRRSERLADRRVVKRARQEREHGRNLGMRVLMT